MQFLHMIWNGISGLGVGTVILKALFILVMGAVFWIFCELVKSLSRIFAKLAVDAMRYLAIVVRGWPENFEEEEDKQGTQWRESKKGPK
ncbi:MAG: hypothetical protein PHH28_01045 [Desulfuromonadaceae bacterium]|nr:hypothetical protein [Desulfuromonadaceae bacterium]